MVVSLHARGIGLRKLIGRGTNEGLAAARARSRVGCRPTVVNDELLRASQIPAQIAGGSP